MYPSNDPQTTPRHRRWRSITLAAFTVATVAATLAITTVPAHAQAHATTTSHTPPGNPGTTIDDLADLPHTGSKPGEATANASYFYQYVRNYHGGQCLDGDRNTIPRNGSIVQLWACNGWTNQVWIWNGVTLRNYYGGQCLDGDRNTIPRNGSKVQLWACNGWTNQSWSLAN